MRFSAARVETLYFFPVITEFRFPQNVYNLKDLLIAFKAVMLFCVVPYIVKLRILSDPGKELPDNPDENIPVVCVIWMHKM